VPIRVEVEKASPQLADLVRMLESGEEDEILLTRNDVPVAKLIPIRQPTPPQQGFV
jgi:antitoxin (DNA-binding transcriptional repressor) of toxin-antitoxin stability system